MHRERLLPIDHNVTQYVCLCMWTINARYFILKNEHSVVYIKKIYSIHCNQNLFMRVRTLTDRKKTVSLNHFQFCCKVLKITINILFTLTFVNINKRYLILDSSFSHLCKEGSDLQIKKHFNANHASQKKYFKHFYRKVIFGTIDAQNVTIYAWKLIK